MRGAGARRRGEALAAAGVDGRAVEAIALDTTGSSVVPVGEGLEPLDDYYLWCDHRAWREAALITRDGARDGSSKPSSGAAASTPPSGVSRSCCTGCGTTRTSAAGSSPPSSTATWWRRCCAASRTRSRCRAASAPWATSGCGTRSLGGLPSGGVPDRRGPAARRRAGEDLRAATRPPTRSRDICRPSGRPSSACAPASRFRSARSTRTGTRSAPACGTATSST